MGKEKTNANLGFEKQIWDAACVLWGHIPAAEYRKVIIGLIFLRYISCVFEKNIISSLLMAKDLKMTEMHIPRIMFSLYLKKLDGMLLRKQLTNLK